MTENEFERRGRLGEAEFERRAGGKPGSRWVESWWWFALVTAQFWTRLLLWPFGDHDDRGRNVFALVSFVLMVIGTPFWVWAMRRAKQRRLEQAATDGSGSAVN